MKPDDFNMASKFKKFLKGGEFSGSYSKGHSSEVTQPLLFSLHCRLQRGIRHRPVSLFLSLEVISRLRHFHRDL